MFKMAPDTRLPIRALRFGTEYQKSEVDKLTGFEFFGSSCSKCFGKSSGSCVRRKTSSEQLLEALSKHLTALLERRDNHSPKVAG